MRAFADFGVRAKSNSVTNLLFGCCMICTVILVGCSASNDDPRNIHIEGTVTLDGKPIKYGKISFTPDTQAGNKGPMGVSKIKNGKYNTDSLGGKAVVGGPHIVEIENFVEVPKGAELDESGISEGGLSGNEVTRVNSGNPIPDGHFEDWDIPIGESPIEKNFSVDAK